MRIAHSEGRDWRKELQKFMLGYRSTPHTTNGASPAKLLLGREIRSKLPDVEELRSASNDSEVLDRDRERKQKGKDYADNLRGACDSNLKKRDKVLNTSCHHHLKPHPMKWSTNKEVMWKSSLLLVPTTKEMLLIYRGMRRTNRKKQQPAILKGPCQKTPKLVRKKNQEFQLSIMRCGLGAIVNLRG